MELLICGAAGRAAGVAVAVAADNVLLALSLTTTATPHATVE